MLRFLPWVAVALAFCVVLAGLMVLAIAGNQRDVLGAALIITVGLLMFGLCVWAALEGERDERVAQRCRLTRRRMQ